MNNPKLLSVRTLNLYQLRLIILFFLFAPLSILAQQQKSEAGNSDSVIVRRTLWVNVTAGYFFPGYARREINRFLNPLETGEQVYKIRTYAANRFGININATLIRRVSVNAGLGLNVFANQKTYALVQETGVKPNGVPYIKEMTTWTRNGIAVNLFGDLGIGYCAVCRPRFDLSLGAGFSSNETLKTAVSRIVPHMHVYLSAMPRFKISRSGWLHLRYDYCDTGNGSNYTMLEAGLGFRIDNERKLPRRRPLYIRTYEE